MNLRAIIQAGEHLDQSGKPITAKALARRLGVHRSTVCQWLKADFPDLYDRHYLTFNELWASLKQDSTKPRPVVLDLPKEPEADELI